MGEQYDVVVLDWRMPVVPGALILETLLDVHPQQRVVVFSNEDPSEVRSHLSRYPTVDFVSKQSGVAPLIELLAQAVQDESRGWELR